jgi:hypothetical protein
MYPTEPAEEIFAALPRRTWSSIWARANHLQLQRPIKKGGIIRPDMSTEDFQIAKQYDIPLENLGKSLFIQWV